MMHNVEALGIVLTAYAATGPNAAGEHRYREYCSVVQTELGEHRSVKIEMGYQSPYGERIGERTESVGLK